jgi:uncharacterized protein YkwD
VMFPSRHAGQTNPLEHVGTRGLGCSIRENLARVAVVPLFAVASTAVLLAFLGGALGVEAWAAGASASERAASLRSHLAAASLSSRCKRTGQQREPSVAISIEKSVLCLLNSERARRGLRALRRNPALDEAARWQSRDMIAHGYFDHQRPGGPNFVERIRRTGYLRDAAKWALGENIAWGEGPLSTRSIVSGWMKSKHHRENILDVSYRAIGVGVALERSDAGNAANPAALTATTDFGSRSGG